jgi:hypothetical protein
MQGSQVIFLMVIIMLTIGTLIVGEEADRRQVKWITEPFLSQNLKRKATYRLAYSLSVDARQETDMPLLAFPA